MCAWTYWWELNKDAFLHPSGDVVAERLVQSAELPIVETIAAALRRSLEAEANVDIVTSCLIALAKIGDGTGVSSGAELGGVIAGFLPNSDQEIAETAALALGIQASSGHVLLLASLLRDDLAGRMTVAKSEVGTRTRAFAAYALGLIGQRTSRAATRTVIARELLAVLRPGVSAASDVQVACVIALGLVQLETHDAGEPSTGAKRAGADVATRAARVEALLAYFEDERSDSVARSHCPTALARLCEGESGLRRAQLKERVARALLARCEKDSQAPPEVVRGCVIALGSLGDGDDDPVDDQIRQSLVRAQDEEGDELACRLAHVSLASAAARRGEDEAASSARAAEFARQYLIRLQQDRGSLREWSALGAGILGRSFPESSDVRAAICAALVGRIQTPRSARQIGAFAIALGILGHKDAIEPLRALLATVKDDEALGYCCVALGMLGAVEAVGDIQSIVAASKYRPDGLRQSVLALSLLGDQTMIPKLVTMLGDAKSQASQASAASAVGLIGDAGSVDLLVAMLQDTHRTERSRGYAAVALGLLAHDERLPWNASIAVNLNYAAAPETLNHPDKATGILNIL